MSKSKIWSKTPPKVEGWYWVRYKGRSGPVTCPARLFTFKTNTHLGEFMLTTARNDTFFSFSIDKKDKLEYGSYIEYPEQ